MLGVPNYGEFAANSSTRGDLQIIETSRPEPISDDDQMARLLGDSNWIDLKNELGELSRKGRNKKRLLDAREIMYTDLMTGINFRNI